MSKQIKCHCGCLVDTYTLSTGEVCVSSHKAYFGWYKDTITQNGWCFLSSRQLISAEDFRRMLELVPLFTNDQLTAFGKRILLLLTDS